MTQSSDDAIGEKFRLRRSRNPLGADRVEEVIDTGAGTRAAAGAEARAMAAATTNTTTDTRGMRDT